VKDLQSRIRRLKNNTSSRSIIVYPLNRHLVVTSGSAVMHDDYARVDLHHKINARDTLVYLFIYCFFFLMTPCNMPCMRAASQHDTAVGAEA
jgi:hypothetical protein